MKLTQLQLAQWHEKRNLLAKVSCSYW